MHTEITTRHFALDEATKSRTEDRLQKLQRFFDPILDARVVVSLERNRYTAEVTVTANGTPLSSSAAGDNERAALEQMLDKIEAQLRRHKDRMVSTRRRNRGESLVELTPEEEEEVVAFDEDDVRDLISEDAGDFSVSMPVAEAAAQLRASRRDVLGFTNTKTGRLSFIFKRRDGNLGVVNLDEG